MMINELIDRLTAIRDENGGEIPVCDTDGNLVIGANFDNEDGEFTVFIESEF